MEQNQDGQNSLTERNLAVGLTGGIMTHLEADRPVVSLVVLERFLVRVGSQPVDVPPVAQKLIALTALLGGAARRYRLAGTLWPDGSTDRALANLRGALWRIPRMLRAHVETRDVGLVLGPHWTIDLDLALEGARRIALGRYDSVQRGLFAGDLLPDWDDDWLVLPRERHRQLRLHALEDLAAADIRAGRALDAVDTAMAAVAAEPLRESAQLLLLHAHLAAGNRAAVVCQFERFRTLLAHELGVEPSAAMRAVVAEAMACG